MRKKSAKTSEFVREIIEVGVPTLVSHLEISDERANVAMREVAHGICQRLGGNELYVPKDVEWALQRRDVEIAREHADGVPTPDIAKKYNISTRQVQVLVRHVAKHVFLRGATSEASPTRIDSSRLAERTADFSLEAWNAIRATPAAAPGETEAIALKQLATPEDVRVRGE